MTADLDDPILASTRGERALQDALGTRDRAQKFTRDQMSGRLTGLMRAFISRMEMMWVATCGEDGHCDCSFRAGPPGFVRVYGENTLVYPDYRGNGVMASSGNLLENPHISLWFGDFDAELIGLHVNGRAAVFLPEQMRVADPDLPVALTPGQQPTHWVVISVDEAYVHCRKRLPRLVRPPEDAPRPDGVLARGRDPFGVMAGKRELD